MIEVYCAFPMIRHYFTRLIFPTSPPPSPNLMVSLVALVYSIIDFMIRLLETHLFR